MGIEKLKANLQKETFYSNDKITYLHKKSKLKLLLHNKVDGDIFSGFGCLFLMHDNRGGLFVLGFLDFLHALVDRLDRVTIIYFAVIFIIVIIVSMIVVDEILALCLDFLDALGYSHDATRVCNVQFDLKLRSILL